jgi:hypothetical protein
MSAGSARKAIRLRPLPGNGQSAPGRQVPRRIAPASHRSGYGRSVSRRPPKKLHQGVTFRIMRPKENHSLRRRQRTRAFRTQVHAGNQRIPGGFGHQRAGGHRHFCRDSPWIWCWPTLAMPQMNGSSVGGAAEADCRPRAHDPAGRPAEDERARCTRPTPCWPRRTAPAGPAGAHQSDERPQEGSPQGRA